MELPAAVVPQFAHETKVFYEGYTGETCLWGGIRTEWGGGMMYVLGCGVKVKLADVFLYDNHDSCLHALGAVRRGGGDEGEAP
jgi:hypothetical protein